MSKKKIQKTTDCQGNSFKNLEVVVEQTETRVCTKSYLAQKSKNLATPVTMNSRYTQEHLCQGEIVQSQCSYLSGKLHAAFY